MVTIANSHKASWVSVARWGILLHPQLRVPKPKSGEVERPAHGRRPKFPGPAAGASSCLPGSGLFSLRLPPPPWSCIHERSQSLDRNSLSP